MTAAGVPMIPSPAPGRRAVVFDLFGVLTHVQSSTHVQAMADALGVAMDRFQTAYWHDRAEYDRGTLDGPAYWRLVAAALDRSIRPSEVERLIDLDVASWDRPNEDMVDFAEDVARAGFVVAILSNSPAEITRRFASYPWIDRRRTFFSSDLGLIKPEPAAFRVVVDDLGFGAHDVVFIDDRAENRETARSLGLTPLEYRTGRTTTSELARALASIEPPSATAESRST